MNDLFDYFQNTEVLVMNWSSNYLYAGFKILVHMYKNVE